MYLEQKLSSTKERDEKIKLVAEKGTQNILDNISNDCKIIFPSTHVIFEGIDKVKTDIKEDDDDKPVLSYALSKSLNEKTIKTIRKNI